jgi:uncharacterized protein YjbI with pentapeptide repeats
VGPVARPEPTRLAPESGEPKVIQGEQGLNSGSALSQSRSLAVAKTDIRANPGSASKTTKPFSKIETYLTGMHPTSVHLMGGYLMGVYLTGVCLMGVYLTGAYLTGVSLIGVRLYISRACILRACIS